MFQNFAATSAPEQGPARLKSLREIMKAEGLSGFVVPRADVHQGEYCAPCDERLAWLTGFSGSAGFCAALHDIAGVFVDGRYRLQVKTQVAADFTPVDWPDVGLGEWLIEHLPEGGVVGFDPWLHTIEEIAKLTEALASSGITLRPTENLINRIWTDRPAPPSAKFTAYPDEIAGETSATKRARLAAELRKAGHAAAALTLPDSIAWLLNIRGRDIEKNPVPQSFAILYDDGRCDLFCRSGKAADLTDHLGADVAVRADTEFAQAVAVITGPVVLDPKSAPHQLLALRTQTGAPVVRAADPCVLPKARKNATEIAGTREAHLRDGAAVVRFLAWLDAEAPAGGLTEVDVVTALEGFRRDSNALLDISFDTICGAGPNGAIMHYRVTDQSNRAVNAGELLVVDSGGQYIDGTTDITRTIGIGPVGQVERDCYTRVLKGLIAIHRARFPKKVAGMHLDALARAPLWAVGLDFDHGTGHGVGVYLCVHEGPQRLSRVSDTPLEPGMILSNEPGYYRNGAFGIRLENLIVVTPPEAIAGGDPHRALMGFETLTYVPFDRALIDVTLLSREERDWLNTYHSDTLAKIGPRLDGDALDWLTGACQPL